MVIRQAEGAREYSENSRPEFLSLNVGAGAAATRGQPASRAGLKARVCAGEIHNVAEPGKKRFFILFVAVLHGLHCSIEGAIPNTASLIALNPA